MMLKPHDLLWPRIIGQQKMKHPEVFYDKFHINLWGYAPNHIDHLLASSKTTRNFLPLEDIVFISNRAEIFWDVAKLHKVWYNGH